jgi:23S rRNA pseudouridine2604 synthase
VERVTEDTFRIVLTQGLNRQIRRMAKALGYQVTFLKRLRILNLTVHDLNPGEWRHLTDEELRTLQRRL